MRTNPALLVLSFLLAGASAAFAQMAPMSDQEAMTDLQGAAPQSVLDQATIMTMDADHKTKVIREGSNGWTCMNPGGAPMCADKAAMEWIHAWKSKGPVPQTIGFMYMLKGDGGTSNTDPYSSKETADNNWVKTGPHIMIVGAVKDMAQAYPRDAKADPTKPFVMWPGTPYEHLMMPVQ